MFCRKCGEENPDNASFCRNCGESLKEEEVKKAEIIENTHDPNKNPPKDNDNDWTKCCLCIVVVFVVFGILSLIFRI